MDAALTDRFLTVEMDILTKNQEIELLTYLYPSLDEKYINIIAECAELTRNSVLYSSDPQYSKFITTRQTVEMAGLVYDGFLIKEALEVVVYPNYTVDGGNDSERSIIKRELQGKIPIEEQRVTQPKSNKLYQEIFTEEDKRNAVS